MNNLNFIKKIYRPYGYKINARNADLIWADKNENYDSIQSRYLKKILKNIDINAVRYYPDLKKLYKNISDWQKVKINQIYLNFGSDSAIESTFKIFTSKNTKIIHTDPSFAMYNVYSQIYRTNTYLLKYKYLINDTIHFDFNSLIKKIKFSNIKIIFLPNSDSPTGSYLDQDKIKFILNIAKKNETIVFIDETYFPFFKETSINHIGNFKNLIIARSFSKSWGLAGLRVGYLLGSPNIIDFYHRTKPMYETSNFAVNFLNILFNDLDKVTMSVERLLNGKSYFESEMKRIGFPIIKSEGNFSYVNFLKKSKLIHKNLSKMVIYRTNSKFDLLKNYSRFSSLNKSTFSKIIGIIKNS